MAWEKSQTPGSSSKVCCVCAGTTTLPPSMLYYVCVALTACIYCPKVGIKNQLLQILKCNPEAEKHAPKTFEPLKLFFSPSFQVDLYCLHKSTDKKKSKHRRRLTAWLHERSSFTFRKSTFLLLLHSVSVTVLNPQRLATKASYP